MNTDKKIRLSYVLTTFNKLAYLKVTLPDLAAACKEDEEIIVYDGGSKDGTAEFLQDNFDKGLIHQFVSEKDFGEANGYNKAMLAAKGTLIKIISDDDAYDYEAISFCKEFMCAHPGVHLVAADGYGVNNLLQHNNFHRRYQVRDFNSWKQTRKPFIFCGLSIMLRKDALPLLGLWDPNFLIIDFEYALRVTKSKATIGWYSGVNYVNIVNEKSNSGNHWRRMEVEKEQLERLYLGKSPLISFKVKDAVKNIVRPLKYRLFPGRTYDPVPYAEIYKLSKQKLKDENASIKSEIFM